ncbi:MAG: phosphotransferase [Minisyncoccia bacterium]
MSVPASSQQGISKEQIEYFITWAKRLVDDDAVVEKTPHGDEALVYKVDSKKGNYFLKIKPGSKSTKELDRLKWFKEKLPVPEVVGAVEKDGSRAMLTTALLGKDLKELAQEWPAEKVVEKLVEILHTFHSVDAKSWPFDEPAFGKIIIHGDACLPNFIFNKDNFSGYIDLGGAELGDRDVDLATAIWSLEYNLGKGYGLQFLQKYGYENPTEEIVEKLCLSEEARQRELGFL